MLRLEMRECTKPLNYHNLRREVTGSEESDRRRWHEIADRMETVAAAGDFGRLFRLKLLFVKDETSAFHAPRR